MTDGIPDKLHFKIGEVSRIAEVAPHVLRYWESEFNTIKPKRIGSAQRLYRRQDVELILTIKDLLHRRGYTIAGARKLLEETTEPSELRPREMPADNLATQLGSIKQELITLKNLLSKQK